MENTSTGLLSSLAALGSLQDINGLWFNQKNFTIDGYRFINCRLDSCTLHVNTLNFEFINCHIDIHSVIIFGNQAIKLVQLYNSRNEYAYQSLDVFAPEKNLDGTISIKGLR